MEPYGCLWYNQQDVWTGSLSSPPICCLSQDPPDSTPLPIPKLLA